MDFIRILPPQSNDLRNVAAEGLAKLLLSGRVLSAKLFLRLLLLWYNPTTEDDVNLRHCLGVFFPVFAFASRYVRVFERSCSQVQQGSCRGSTGSGTNEHRGCPVDDLWRRSKLLLNTDAQQCIFNYVKESFFVVLWFTCFC